ncbi:hypothetical protein SJAG_04326 [Schizosaccharomyces japonicus yFS275]|uniref:ABM domain-containing protein n=1 Tax=Schizosaccharomyces japonicus (strain yFS275 / FY16936) TaxID=402676 RepID=B6K6J3_SCHJY|nr:hypothetical protein SJAG_04326 [Schizosaccharomyces japonicus yFS275]EEB09147.1 hypothetical protein SJAG_04326 [Schizosaccharomyces japonicus yFS275]
MAYPTYDPKTHVYIAKIVGKAGEGKNILKYLSAVNEHAVKNEPFTQCYYFATDNENPEFVWGLELYGSKDILENKHKKSDRFLDFAGYLSGATEPLAEPLQLMNYEVVGGFIDKSGDGANPKTDDQVLYVEYTAKSNPEALKAQLKVDDNAETSFIIHSLDNPNLFGTITRYSKASGVVPQPQAVTDADVKVQRISYSGVGYLTHP